MGNHGKAQVTMDGQLWQSSGNDGWATMAKLRQRWMGNHGKAQATMEPRRVSKASVGKRLVFGAQDIYTEQSLKSLKKLAKFYVVLGFFKGLKLIRFSQLFGGQDCKTPSRPSGAPPPQLCIRPLRQIRTYCYLLFVFSNFRGFAISLDRQSPAHEVSKLITKTRKYETTSRHGSPAASYWTQRNRDGLQSSRCLSCVCYPTDDGVTRKNSFQDVKDQSCS